MKRLLLGPALAIPLLSLGLCHLKTPEVPKVPEVVREIPMPADFNTRFPPITPQPEKPQWNTHAPTRPHVPARTHVRPRKPSRPVVQPAPPVQPEPLPPQEGPICIFPFNMIPNCVPQAIL